MSASAEYVTYIQDLLCDLPDLNVKTFLGGKALRSSYSEGLDGEMNNHSEDTQFAMIINDVLYFVVDDISRPKYESLGMTPFQYEKKTGIVKETLIMSHKSGNAKNLESRHSHAGMLIAF